MFFRRGISHDEWLQVKLWLFGTGAILALLGMALHNDWLMGLAGLVLAAGILLRFLNRDDSGDLPERGPPG